jgi:8-oxo-dGTP pyrophosphatase MutT (NUDIX family)
MLSTAENIRKALNETLPGLISHKKMLPLNRVLKVPSADLGRLKHSSVLLLLFMDRKRLCCVLIKRPAHMKHHAGQIALPGGRIEKGETALETAFRETWEEIGVSKNKIEILGTLSDLYVEVSRFQIHPFVGWLKQKPVFNIDRNEVEKTILFPLKNLKNNFEEIELSTVKGQLKVPCIQFEGEIIWGATAMILSEFFDTTRDLITTRE